MHNTQLTTSSSDRRALNLLQIKDTIMLLFSGMYTNPCAERESTGELVKRKCDMYITIAGLLKDCYWTNYFEIQFWS